MEAKIDSVPSTQCSPWLSHAISCCGSTRTSPGTPRIPKCWAYRRKVRIVEGFVSMRETWITDHS